MMNKENKINEVLEARSVYGDFSKNAILMQDMKTDLRAHPDWWEVPADQREAIEMIVHKIGRIVGGTEHHEDNWIDIQGYTQLIINKNRSES